MKEYFLHFVLVLGLVMWSGCRNPEKANQAGPAVLAQTAVTKPADETERRVGVPGVQEGKTNDISAQGGQKVFYFIDHPHKGTNVFVWRPGLTVLRAIALTGGFTEWAKTSTVKLVRANGETYMVNLRAAQENPALDLPVNAYDTLSLVRRGVFGF